MWRKVAAAFYGVVACQPNIEVVDVILITNCNKIKLFKCS